MNLPCNWIKPLINQYIDNELNLAKRLLVARHLKECPQCKAHTDNSLMVKQAVRDVQSALQSPYYLKESIFQKISIGQKTKTTNWALSPEFSWGVVSALILAVLVGYLIFIKPDVFAYNIITIANSAYNRQPISEISSVLNYLGKTEGDIIQPTTLTIQNGEDALVLHMTIKKNKEILIYTHGNYADIKPADLSGARLKGVSIDGKNFYIGNFVGMKVVCWKTDGEPYAVVIVNERA